MIKIAWLLCIQITSTKLLLHIPIRIHGEHQWTSVACKPLKYYGLLVLIPVLCATALKMLPAFNPFAVEHQHFCIRSPGKSVGVPRHLGCSQRYWHLGPHLVMTRRGRGSYVRVHEGIVWQTKKWSKIGISEMSIHIFEVSFLEFRSIVFQSLGFGVTIQIEREVAFETTQDPKFGHQMWLETAPSTTHFLEMVTISPIKIRWWLGGW